MGDGRKQIGGPISSATGASAAVQQAALVALDSTVAMAVIDTAGKLVHVSTRWCELTGLAAEEVLGEHWGRVVHPQDLPDALVAGRHVVEAGTANTYESRIATREGRVMWIESQITPLFDEDGSLHSWLLVTTDLTPHKEATEALRQSERRLQVIFDNSTDIITILDEDGVARSTSSGGYRQLGYLEAPMLEDDSVLMPEDRPILDAVVNHLKDSGSQVSEPFGVRVWAADGGVRWLESVAVNLLDEPAVRGIVVHSRDVTGTLEALEGLRTMATRLDSLVSHLFLGVMLADEQGEILFANDALTELCGLGPPAQLIGRSLDLLREDLRGLYADYDAALERIMQILEAREPVRDETVVLRDGNMLARSFVPIFDDGAYRGHLWLFRDLGPELAIAAEREHLLAMEKEQNARLMELDALKTDLVASVSHDLRTPLTSIISFARLLRDGLGTDTPDDQREFLDTIERNTSRLHRLVDDLVLLDHLESNRLQLNVGPVDLAAVVRGAVASMRPAAEQHTVTLHLQTVDGPCVNGDVDRLGQMVDNLLSNAVKFAGTGGRVEVSVAPQGDRWRVEVRDHGIGIPKDEIELLFERFYRASNARREAISGSGLGLSIAQRVAELHHGTIRIDSTEGVGTTAVIELLGVGVGGDGVDPVLQQMVDAGDATGGR